MIGTSLQQVSRARSNKARLLVLFLFLSLVAHGLFFTQELLLLGFVLSSYVLVSYPYRRNEAVIGTYLAFGLTDALLWGLILFSLLGLFHPVKVSDGLLEALRWGILWFVYCLGVQISTDERAKELLTKQIEGLALVVALWGWVPWVNGVGGRLSSVFGYPNATAAFIGAVLLLSPRRRPVQIFLAITLLSTGSRAGVALCLATFIIQQGLLWTRQRNTSFLALQRSLQAQQLSKLGVILLGIVGAVLLVHFNTAAWDNFTTNGFSSASWQERLVYFRDGIKLAWKAGGFPQAGGWMAFPTVQRFPYWTTDPHSSLIHILLNQGILGLMSVVIWGSFVLARAWRIWRKQRLSPKSTTELEATKRQVRVWGALLFLVLHSLVDADFSFGALGFLFWLLLGSIQKNSESLHPLWRKGSKFVNDVSGKGMLVLGLTLALLCGSTLLKPTLLEKDQTWNALARQERDHDPDKSSNLWSLSLNWDQTQMSVRREQAELLIKTGNTESGLQAVEKVLSWQPFDLEAYEWAQSLIWGAAELQRREHPETAANLYRWVESVPQKIEGKVALLNSEEQFLWHGYRDFKPSEHVKLLAAYARQRQLAHN